MANKTQGEFKITTWKYTVGVESYQAVIYHVTSKDRSFYRAKIKSSKFNYGENREFESDSIVELEQDVKASFVDIADVIWTKYLSISRGNLVSRSTISWDSGSASFSVDIIEIGSDSEGNEFWRKDGSGFSHRGHPGGNIIIDTEENREALKSVSRSLFLIEEKLDSLMGQENWVSLVANLPKLIEEK